MMKRILLGATLTLAAAPAFAEDWDFILVNDTGKSIKGIEIAEGGSGKWVANKVDPDRKREGVTGPGKRMTVHFNKGAGCKYDLKATFADNSTAVWPGVDVCDNAFVTVSYANGTPTFKAN